MKPLIWTLILSQFLAPWAFAKDPRDLDAGTVTFRQQSSTPSNPPSGRNRCYVKTDGKTYCLDSSGNENPLGSGGGGSSGLNLLSEGNANPNAEQGTVNHTASGGTFTTVASSPVQPNDAKHFQWAPSGSNQAVTTSQVAITERLKGQNCSAQISYKTSEGTNLYILNAINGSSVIISTVTLGSTNGNWQKSPVIYFPCPSGTDTAALQVKAAASTPSANIQWDDEYLGELATASLSQASFVGALTYAATASCFWDTTSSSFGNYSATSACPTPTVEGAISAPGTKIPGVTLASGLDRGRYFVVATGVFSHTNSVNTETFGAWRLTDGTNNTSETGSAMIHSVGTGGVNVSSDAVLLGDFNYSSAVSGPMTIQIQGKAISATVTMRVDAINQPLRISVYRYPSAAETAMRFDTVSWRVDANIGGANPALSTAAQSSYIAIQDAGLDIVTNTGSIGVQIPCSGTNPSTGSTCAAGNEELGVAFNLPRPGAVVACVSFHHFRSQATFTQVNTVFQVVETPNTSDTTILQEGKTRVGDFLDIGGASASNQSQSHRNCGTFEFTSSGLKTLRLMYEQSISAGSITSNYIAANRDPNAGQIDVHWEVYPINQQVPAPLLVGGVISTLSGVARVEWASIANNGTATIANAGSGFLSSVSRTSAGIVTNNFAVPFSAVPICFCQSSVGNGEIFYINSTSTSSVVCGNTATATDRAYNLMCMGPR